VRIPFSVEEPDRLPKQRYYDADFFALEAERLWPRVWQMACRLEEIPEANDFVVYEILDQSVIVVRTEDDGVRALQNACKHRGVQVASGEGSCAAGFVCPFHGWTYGSDGTNTFVPRKRAFAEHNLVADDINLTPVRCETWGGCAWINLDASAPPLRECLEPFATALDAWQVETMKVEWWRAFRLPVNWKLAEAAFMEQYHVIESHPQLVIPGRFPPKTGQADIATLLEGELQYLRTMSDGMAGMVHANDVAIAERLAAETEVADMDTWHRALNDAVVEWHRARGAVIPDLNELEANGFGDSLWYGFPHYFVLPMYSSASSYRFRPLGPEETLMEVWSLTRFPEGEARPKPTPPEVWEYDDPRVPPIPTQDFSNLPKQQRGLHQRGFEYLRISPEVEGHLSNFERAIDGFLAGLPYEQLLKALQQINLNPLERPVVDLGL
jgi:phenylpropionate dioxygenase-like ring-hydroxylating dioxygenase large terminal subunit